MNSRHFTGLKDGEMPDLMPSWPQRTQCSHKSQHTISEGSESRYTCPTKPHGDNIAEQHDKELLVHFQKTGGQKDHRVISALRVKEQARLKSALEASEKKAKKLEIASATLQKEHEILFVEKSILLQERGGAHKKLGYIEVQNVELGSSIEYLQNEPEKATEDTRAFKIWTQKKFRQAQSLEGRGKERKERSLRRPPWTRKTPDSNV
jgi:hypothetical protein